MLSTDRGTLKPIKIAEGENGRSDGYDHGEEGQEQPLSPVTRLFHEPGNEVYILSFLGLKSKMTPDIIKVKLAQTLLNHPRFSSLQVRDKKSGEMKWVPTKVNLDDHVIIPDLNSISFDSPDQFVEDYTTKLTTTTLDPSKPLWDLHLLDLKTSDAEGCGILRTHHSLGDGMSLTSLLLTYTHKVSDPTVVSNISTSLNKASTLMQFLGFKSAMRLMWNTLVGVLAAGATTVFLKDTETPLKGKLGCECNPRCIVKRTISMDDIKMMKKAMNVTVNDVVVGIVQLALSQYLNRNYGEMLEKNRNIDVNKNYLPKNIRLRSTFFFNIRPSTVLQSLVDMVEKEEDGSPIKWGNKFGYVVMPLVIGLYKDPLEYVAKAKVVMDQKKASLEPLCSYIFLKLLIKLFGIEAAAVINYKIFTNTTVPFSNVPGPGEGIAFYGHEVAYVAASVYGQPNALTIHSVSYTDKLTFAISVDKETIPDPHWLCDDLEDAFKVIKAAVLAKYSKINA